MELKVSSTKSDEDCELQLKANMYNLLVREFVNDVYSASNLSDLENRSHCTIYGMFFGFNRPVIVLKLTVDLKTQTLTYMNKFRSNTGLATETMIDSCIEAILHRLTTKKSPPA